MEYFTCVNNLKLNRKYFSIIDEISFRAKNLYNSALYEIYNYYDLNYSYINYGTVDKLMKNHESNTSYKMLNAQMAQQILRKLDKNFSSFFVLLKKTQRNEYDKPIDKPKYLPKDGRKELIFTEYIFRIKDNKIILSIPKDLQLKYGIKFLEFNVPKYIIGEKIKYIEIIPKSGRYLMSIVYKNNKEIAQLDSANWMSIDLGINNLCAITSNVHKPVLINGRYIKSINKKFTNKISQYHKLLNGKYISNNINKSFIKRNHKLTSELHTITTFICELAKTNNISNVVIGYNEGWKQKSRLGKKNNQIFNQIPYTKLISQLLCKLYKNGISLIMQEESYTSKCSFMDEEPCCKQQTYKGKREKRGLFITETGKMINADINASLNIFKKSIQHLEKIVQDELISIPLNTGLIMNPLKISLTTDTSKSEIEFLISKINISKSYI